MRRVGMMLCAAALGLAVVAGCSGDEEPTAETTQDAGAVKGRAAG